jgi:hypothetical protein
VRPPSSAQSTKTVPVPMMRLLMMCLWASITCSAELRSIRWKPTKREAVRAPSRIWMSRKKEKVNSRLATISVPSAGCARWACARRGPGHAASRRSGRDWSSLVGMNLRCRGSPPACSARAAEHDLDLFEKAPLQKTSLLWSCFQTSRASNTDAVGSTGQTISQTPQPTQGSWTTGDLRLLPSGAKTVSIEIAPLIGHSRTQRSHSAMS